MKGLVFTMKKLISAILACVFVFALTTTVFAANSPSAPVIDETTTKDPSDIDPTIDGTTTETTTAQGDKETTTAKGDKETTTAVGDVDETTTAKGDKETTTKGDVTSDKGPVSPDTGSHVSKTVGAAALVALTLGGAVVYTTKKKAE